LELFHNLFINKNVLENKKNVKKRVFYFKIKKRKKTFFTSMLSTNQSRSWWRAIMLL